MRQSDRLMKMFLLGKYVLLENAIYQNVVYTKAVCGKVVSFEMVLSVKSQ